MIVSETKNIVPAKLEEQDRGEGRVDTQLNCLESYEKYR